MPENIWIVALFNRESGVVSAEAYADPGEARDGARRSVSEFYAADQAQLSKDGIEESEMYPEPDVGPEQASRDIDRLMATGGGEMALADGDTLAYVLPRQIK